MRILLVMDPGIPVPPKLYGGHERLVALFAAQYTRMGHKVTLLAGPDSYCEGETVTFGVNDLKRSVWQKTKEIFFAWRFLLFNHTRFDVVHNFGRLVYLVPILNKPVFKIMTYGRPVTQKGIQQVTSRPNNNLIFTACSNYCVSTGDISGSWHTVYNAIDFTKYTLKKQVDINAPLMFLGRLDRVKGVHTAIEVAKKTNHQLLIAGNIPHTDDNYAYYKKEIEPLIDDEQIKYIGALDDEGKNKYLGVAKALLFPIEWDEPFGIVMIEAMACGTPVIAFNRGSVPEVINDKCGIIVTTTDEMIEAIGKISDISRSECRASACERFDAPVIARHYLQLIE